MSDETNEQHERIMAKVKRYAVPYMMGEIMTKMDDVTGKRAEKRVEMTPGQWQVIPHDTLKDIYEVANGRGYERQTVACSVMGEANARAIAALPQLIEALQNILLCMDANDGDSLANAAQGARAALEKAGCL